MSATNGRHCAGASNHLAKLDVEKVVEIRRRAVAGETQISLARAYGVSHTTISHIVRNLTWCRDDIGLPA